MNRSTQSIWSKIKPWVLPSQPDAQVALQLAPGLKHYRRERNGEHVRYHLRVENSGQALLLVAAVEAVRLTRSGAIAAFGVLEGKSDIRIQEDLGGSPHASTIISDVRRMVSELGLPSKRYPIFNLTDPLVEESPQGLIAPFQADMILGDWDISKKCLEALWNAGIPHVRFIHLDGDGTDIPRPLPADRVDLLCSAIEFAEDMGMISGVRITASQLLQKDSTNQQTTLDRVAELGLDYIVVPWGVTHELHSQIFGPTDHENLRQAIHAADCWEITPVLEAGLTRQSQEAFETNLDSMRKEGIEHVEVFALAHDSTSTVANPPASAIPAGRVTPFEPQQLRQLASWIEDVADHRRLQVIWLPTVGINGQMDEKTAGKLLRRGPRAGADISIRLEANGQVIPPRGVRQSVGVIHQNSWHEIWGHPSFYRYRDMVNRSEHCSECPMLSMCAAHCPADPAGWALES